MKARVGIVIAVCAAALALPAVATASSGGVPSGLPPVPPVPPAPPTCGSASGGIAGLSAACSPQAATLTAGGRAIAPATAPAQVKAVIAAANRISTKPYVWGGGHSRWWDRGYDCSGAVSYVLHKGGFLTSPLDSTGFERWGAPGQGQWITVYSNPAHAYAVIAGLRWDTAGDASGTGPRWHPTLTAAASGVFKVRHPVGF